MNWKVKAAIFRILSVIPNGERLHYALQCYVTREWPRPPDKLDLLLVAAKRLFSNVDERIDLKNAHFLEIGAGRDLAIAVALRLLGVQRIICVDITRHAKPHLVAHAAKHMALRLGMRAPKIDSWEDVEAFGITYVAPSDIVALKLQASSIDCFYSVDTLEHIPKPIVKNIFKEVRRIIKPTGISIHFIDYSDHYGRGDAVSRFNFLTFS